MRYVGCAQSVSSRRFAGANLKHIFGSSDRLICAIEMFVFRVLEQLGMLEKVSAF